MAVARRRLLLCAGLALAAAAGMALLWWRDPRALGIPACPFFAITGLYCPGCGSLRGLHQLAHGNFAAAFGQNPLMVFTLPFIAYAPASECRRQVFGSALPMPALPRWLGWGVLAVVVAYWVARNIPVEPFLRLAPT